MASILLVQAMRCTCNRSAYFCNVSKVRVRMTLCELINHLLQRLALHMFHHQIRNSQQITSSNKTGYVPALQNLQNLMLYFEANDVLGPVACRHAWYFHHHRKRNWPRIGICHFINMRHTACVQTGAN